MRQTDNPQLQFGQIDISEIQFDLKSRDDIPQLLKGLQFLYTTREIRREIFGILEEKISPQVQKKTGRPGMELWKILVMGVLRLNLNWDYDRLHEMVNNHQTIRQMLGHAPFDNEVVYNLRTLKDNVVLLSPEILEEINLIVVKAGHQLVKKKGEKLEGRCDSFVVETNVHYPTDINLLFDAIRKVILLMAQLCFFYGCPGWRQQFNNVKQVKRLFRKAQKIKHSTSEDPVIQQNKQKLIKNAHQAYLDLVASFLERTEVTLDILRKDYGALEEQMESIQSFIEHAKRQISQVQRRVIEGETIPHNEKVFSVFQEHTEWISKGKAGVPVELGLKVCILEEQNGFILSHHVMQKQTDDIVAVFMVEKAQANFPDLRQCSFDKGFHTPANQKKLRTLLESVILPKKGKLSQQDRGREYSEDFIAARHQHSAVESAINALEVHGLDKCPDHGIDGFERYIALAVLARNIQKIGSILRIREKITEKRKRAA